MHLGALREPHIEMNELANTIEQKFIINEGKNDHFPNLVAS